MNIFKTLLAALLLVPAFLVVAPAQDLPALMTDPVSDFAGVLYDDEEAKLAQILTETRETTGIHMVVVTVAGLASQGGEGMSLAGYTDALFDQWGIGDLARDDGIMLLLDTESREARIALGAGFDPVYGARAKRVLETAVLPALREGRLAAGIEAGILSARAQLITPFLAGAKVSETDGFAEEGSGFPFGTIFLGAFGFLGFNIWRKRRASRKCPSCGALSLTRKRETITAPTRKEPGVGLQHLNCSACGFVDRLSFAIPFSAAVEHDHNRPLGPSGGIDSTGFGGGSSGGGSSDGGGASGKW